MRRRKKQILEIPRVHPDSQKAGPAEHMGEGALACLHAWGPLGLRNGSVAANRGSCPELSASQSRSPRLSLARAVNLGPVPAASGK